MDYAALADVTPLPQDDGPEPVCAIAYTPAFVKAHDYLRALLRVDERSARALELTTACLELNPANYTAWHFRRRCLVALSEAEGIDVERIEKDLQWADELGGTNPKNYQLWYHRRALLEFRFQEGADEALAAAVKELEYVDKILDDDSKNYHAWSHRQWILRALNHPRLWSSEVEYSHAKILSDPRNNSAWNQRWFALHRGEISRGGTSGGNSSDGVLSFETCEEEADYALHGANVDPFNESPWRYLIGVLMERRRWAHGGGGTAEDVAACDRLVRGKVERIREMKATWEEDPPSGEIPAGTACVHLISALVDLLEAFAEDGECLTEAKALLGVLVVEDPVRRKYWRRREGKLSRSLEKCPK